jgi:NADPH:quinone reductase-like Zn-dependent oxidoreductase
VKAAIFDRIGLENLKIKEIETPAVGPHDVLVRVRMAGVNPIDFFAVSGRRQVKPMPHTPGSEFAGTVEDVGEHVSSVKKGERVIVFNRVFDGACDMCISGNEMLCRNGGIIGIIVNGGFAEYAALPERNLFKIPDDLDWEHAASLPVAALTAYHALSEAHVGIGEHFVVFGASGSTGMFAVQLGKKLGATVIAITRKDWLKDFGADYVVRHDEAGQQIKQITAGKMADIVLNSLGSETWPTAFNTLGTQGRLVLFGTLTGGKAELDLDKMYNKQFRIIGTTGGNRKELHELINIAGTLRLRVWKKFKLEEASEAISLLSAKERDGRILLESDL